MVDRLGKFRHALVRWRAALDSDLAFRIFRGMGLAKRGIGEKARQRGFVPRMWV